MEPILILYHPDMEEPHQDKMDLLQGKMILLQDRGALLQVIAWTGFLMSNNPIIFFLDLIN
jgi:hypothetical protein